MAALLERRHLLVEARSPLRGPWLVVVHGDGSIVSMMDAADATA
jgi:hypothetical protein